MIALFDRYPLLREKLPYIELADLPTPIVKLQNLAAELSVPDIYMKRDDISGVEYGGNKLRKLEFILGAALANEASEVMTFGYAGSNHALATAMYAHKVGLHSISMLLTQPNAHYVRRNLLASLVYGAEMHLYRSSASIRTGTAWQLLRHRFKCGRFPYYIPAGGSSPLGVVGYVNAALELAMQIEKGELPAPNRIYVGMGTMGTAAGLLLGLRAAGLDCQVISVRATSARIANASIGLRLLNKTNKLLCSLDPSFPHLVFSKSDFIIRDEFYRRRYAEFAEEVMDAMKLAKDTEGLNLDGTYTGKAMAALIADMKKVDSTDPILFWNTFNSRDINPLIENIDYHGLPEAFHFYFEEDVQKLDR